MAIEFGCAACGAMLRVPDEAAGRLVRCRKCQATFRAPTPPPPPEPPRQSEPPVTVAQEWLPEPEPVPEPLPVAEEVLADQASVPNEVLVPAEEVPPPKPRSNRPPKHPRPRRRDFEREPEGSPIKRMLLTLGVIAVVAGVGLGVLVWRSAFGSADWQPYQSARGGGFRVELPDRPRDDIGRRLGFPPAPGTTIEGTVHRRMEYAVVWADFPGGRNPWATDDQIIDAAVQGMRTSAPAASVEVKETLKVNGFNGREVLVSTPAEGVYLFRVIVAETRLYLVAAGGRDGRADHPDVRRFLDSFEVTDSRILANARQKAEAAEKARADEVRRQEEQRRRDEERRLSEEKRLAEEKRREDERRAEEERRRREDEARAEAARRTAEDEAEKFRAPQAGVSAPDPTTLPGLKRYLGFEEITGDEVAVWPKLTGSVPRGAATGPGVRGKALYLAANPRGVVVPHTGLPVDLAQKPFTVAGWAKVADGATVELFRAGGGNLSLTTSLSPDRAWGHVAAAQRHPTERESGVLSAAASGDRWCHVAFSRSGPDSGNRTVLYLDGAPVAVFPFNPALAPYTELLAGSPVLAAQKGEVFYRVPHPDLSVAAVDELCLFDRPLTGSEVRYLAGKAKSPDAPAGHAVRLAPHTAIEPVAGVAFDPTRKALWAVTAVRPNWGPGGAPGRWDQQAFLVKYTYPDFTPAGKWALPPVRVNGRDYTPSGGPPVLDAKNNRLYLPVYNWTGNTNLQAEPERYGTFHRFDLDDLPAAGADEAPVLTPAAKAPDRGAGQQLGGAVVSPDGKWLYYHDPAAFPPAGKFGSPVCRVPDTLTGKPEQVFVPGIAGFPRPVWLSADGKTVRIVQHGKPLTPVGSDVSGVAEIDAEQWEVGKVVPVPITRDRQTSVLTPVTVHPDGRVFTAGTAGLSEYDPATETRRVRPVALAPNAFLKVSDDGRFLFASDSGLGRNNFAVLDARKNPERPDELAAISEDAGVRVGGPFHVSPDGRFVVFRSGLVVRVDEGDAALKPLPKWVPPTPPKDPVVAKPKDVGGVVPKPKDPGEVIPKGKWAVKPYAGGEVASAADLKGVKFHLGFEEVTDGKVKDSVSGKAVGKLSNGELVPGPRGKALRLTAGATPQVPALNLDDQVGVFRAAGDAPFALGLWVRFVRADSPSPLAVAFRGETKPAAAPARQLWFGLEPDYCRLHAAEYPEGKPSGKGGYGINAPQKTPPLGEWFHLVLTRAEKDGIRVWVNGVRHSTRIEYPLPLVWDSLGLGASSRREAVIDVDELFFLDRALSDEEIAALAGRKVLPKPNGPGEIAPKPKAPPEGPPRPVPAASDLKGLRFYLTGDKIEKGAVQEAVSGKFVGSAKAIEQVDGPRGKAIRATGGGPLPAAREGLNLSDQAAELAVGEGKPFTLTVWVRTDDWESRGAKFVEARLIEKEKFRFVSLYPTSKGLGLYLQEGAPGSAPQPQRAVRDQRELPPTRDWVHLTLSRDETGVVRFGVNGELKEATGTFAGELKFTDFALGWQQGRTFTAEFDEFCLFDRVLTADEVELLAGRGGKK